MLVLRSGTGGRVYVIILIILDGKNCVFGKRIILLVNISGSFIEA